MKLKISALSFVLFMMACSVQKPGDKPFFFVQMSDTQFGMFTGDKSFEQETKNFERAVAAANRLHPAFVIICGDLVNKVGDAAQIAEFKRICALLDPSITLYKVPGNHDVGNIPTPSTLTDYHKNIGNDYYTFQKNGIFGIVLNSSLIKDSSMAPEEAAKQEAWFRSALEDARKSKSNHIMVFQHHSWFLENQDEADQYFNIPTTSRKKYLALFEQYGIKYLFAGHYHRNSFGDTGKIQMITTGPVGKPLGPDPSGLRIVTVNGGTVTYNYYGLDAIPDKVEAGR